MNGICLLYLIFVFNSGEPLNITNPPVISDKITYFLFNSTSPQTYILLDGSNTNVLKRSSPIVFLIHGFGASRRTKWYELAKNAFFARDSRYLVIQVDWSFYSKLNYFYAQRDTKNVGYIIGTFIATLNQHYSIPLENILVVGHSLGGHISGFLGQKVFGLLTNKLKRIIALDPAGPLFEGDSDDDRLSPNDAEVVQVIHSNGGQAGYFADCGTIDFRPNGGSFQPGCVLATCHHDRSWRYFVEGIRANNSVFVSRKCDDYITFKFRPKSCSRETEEMCSLVTTRTGRFFLNTNSNSTYSEP